MAHGYFLKVRYLSSMASGENSQWLSTEQPACALDNNWLGGEICMEPTDCVLPHPAGQGTWLLALCNGTEPPDWKTWAACFHTAMWFTHSHFLTPATPSWQPKKGLRVGSPLLQHAQGTPCCFECRFIAGIGHFWQCHGPHALILACGWLAGPATPYQHSQQYTTTGSSCPLCT